MLKAWLQLIRLPNQFSALSNVLAAHLLVTGFAPQWALIWQLLASLAFYSGGMILNDWCDRAEDARERPGRPIPSGRIRAGTALAGALLLFGLGLGLSSLINTQALLLAGLLLLAIWGYDSLGRRGWGAALRMGLCRYLHWLWALALVPVATEGLIERLLLPLPILLFVTALTRLSQQETGGDRRQELPAIWALQALTGLCLLHNGWQQGSLLFLGLTLLAGLHLGWRQYRLWRDFNPATVQAAVMQMVLGLVALDVLLLGSLSGHWAALLLLVLWLPGRLLARWLYVT